MTMLAPGDKFPTLTLRQPGGATFTIPAGFDGGYGIVLFYRGSWCPHCNAQLRAFQRASSTLAEAGAKAAALSVDDEPTTAALIAKHSLVYTLYLWQRGQFRTWSRELPQSLPWFSQRLTPAQTSLARAAGP